MCLSINATWESFLVVKNIYLPDAHKKNTLFFFLCRDGKNSIIKELFSRSFRKILLVLRQKYLKYVCRETEIGY